VTARLPRGDLELVPLRGGAIVRPRQLVHVVGAEAQLALPAVHHGIGEVVEVPARLPDRRVHQDRRVDPHHVRPALHEVAPPHPLDVALELDAERPVVPARPDPAVDLARLEDEAAALGERDERVHGRRHSDQDITCADGPAAARRRRRARAASAR
jgi:hypothetical protein